MFLGAAQLSVHVTDVRRVTGCFETSPWVSVRLLSSGYSPNQPSQVLFLLSQGAIEILIGSSTSSWLRVRVSDSTFTLPSWLLMIGLFSEILLSLILVLITNRCDVLFFRFSILEKSQTIANKLQDLN